MSAAPAPGFAIGPYGRDWLPAEVVPLEYSTPSTTAYARTWKVYGPPLLFMPV